MAADPADRFDIKLVHDNFLASIDGEEDVQLEPYLESYKQLYKFFNLLGSVFGFVSSDVKSKIDILVALLDDERVSSNFKSVAQMMAYEKAEGLLTKQEYVSGSRTLLRLHRGLDFFRAFMKSLGELGREDATSAACQEAYNRTLARYHPWLIRTGAKVAMYTLPTRDGLLFRICGGSDEETQRAIDILPKMLEITSEVYNRVEALYTHHDLHSLP